MKDGREFTSHREIPRGMSNNLVSKDEIKEKYWKNVASARKLPREKAQDALNMLENLEEVDNISLLVESLAA